MIILLICIAWWSKYRQSTEATLQHEISTLQNEKSILQRDRDSLKSERDDLREENRTLNEDKNKLAKELVSLHKKCKCSQEASDLNEPSQSKYNAPEIENLHLFTYMYYCNTLLKKMLKTQK